MRIMRVLGYTALRVQRNQSTLRIHVPAWVDLATEMLAREEEILGRQRVIFTEAADRLKLRSAEIAQVSHLLAELDVASSMGRYALDRRLVRPRICSAPVHHVVGGRHLVVEAVQLERGRTFVSNSCHVGEADEADSSGDGRVWLVTGSNMGGKSTFLRQTLLISIMAQAGMYVPCQAARLGIVDKAFSRIGAGDDIAEGQSTFLLEMTEAAHILREATPHSLVIMDEVGRGTSSQDGACLALAILTHLHDVNKCCTLFATHMHEVAAVLEREPDRLPHARCYHTQTMVCDEGSTFVCLHTLAPGTSGHSHGLEVARMAGLPPSVVAMAQDLQRTVVSEVAMRV
jgi:DNA mismatch repair protein MutS